MKIVNTLNPSTNDLFVGRNEIFDKLKGLFLLNHTKKKRLAWLENDLQVEQVFLLILK